ncbi:MAG: hypothetical protein RMK29_19170 [Myxococcales bacterium]|nr:hypothetical protein [Myxococcota bacterium]MDW8283827.1 hypothetical protein [Myxococcales bacterium]
MRRAFRTFIGVDLGGGKGKTTAVARLRLQQEPGRPPHVVVDDGGSGPGWYDGRLVPYLLRHAGEAVVAIDAPLTLPVCVRCSLPRCPGTAACQVEVVRWFERRRPTADPAGKPSYTPYTQRVTEVLLHEEEGILPREALGQGMGPLTARAAYLRRALSGAYRLHHDLIEVYPRATLARLFPDAERPRAPRGIVYRDGNGRPTTLQPDQVQPAETQPRTLSSHVARHYKRSGHARPVRERILESLPDLRFGPGQWRESALQNDHQLDAVLCAYTAFLWARDGWELPADLPFLDEEGWIWVPPRAAPGGQGPAAPSV